MTREEAKEILLQSKMQCDYPHGAYGVAVDMAIKALEQCEVWDGIHGQVVAPKGTFDRIWEDAEKEEQEPKADILDKIRTEIKAIETGGDCWELELKDEVLEIIDKAIKEVSK